MQLLRGDLQSFLHLLIPVSPIMISRQFAKLVWDLLFTQQCSELRAGAKQPVFGATIKI